MSRISAASAVLAALLCFAGTASGAPPPVPSLRLGSGETIGPVPAHDPLQQAAEVAYLMPETELGVDVISGQPYIAAERLHLPEGGAPGEHEGLIGLMDPQFHNRVFAYEPEGIPGESGWDPAWGTPAAPAPGALPTWAPPRLVSRSGRPVAVVLADGRRVGLQTDSRGRVARVRWATPRGEPLLTSIAYGRGETTISAPAGVVRTYRYNGRRRITEVEAPGAGATGRRDTADGFLDSKATANRIAHRLRPGTTERYRAYETAPDAIGENSFAWPAVGGYQHYGVKSLAWMRKVDASLRKSGVLDVAEAIPILNDRVENYTQEKPFERLTAGLHNRCSFAVRYFGFTYGLSTTAAQIATIAARLSHGPERWIYIYFANLSSLGCAEPV